jgi:hypothetical protein
MVFAVDDSGNGTPYWRYDTHQWKQTRQRDLPLKGKPKVWKKRMYQLKHNGNFVDFHRDEYTWIGKH